MAVVPLSPGFFSRSFSRNDLIIYYSMIGLSTGIIQRLLQRHGYLISKRHLRRLRHEFGVSALAEEADIPSICSAITEELEGSGSLLGYRSMLNRLKITHQMSVRRDTVMMLLPILDPQGSLDRARCRLKRRVYRSKGPNFIWHCDGYDKLKPFGITIHGCIDGYSRRIIWMACGSSNNDPQIVAQHYFDAIECLNGLPCILRTDRGTENSIICFLHPSLRSNHTDEFAGEKSFRYGRSSSNQRIEAWWSYLRTRLTDWWITFFKDLISSGCVDDSLDQHIEAVRFCFIPVIRIELRNLVNEWNHHNIRPSKRAETSGGIPEILFFLPEQSGTIDYKCNLDKDLFEYAKSTYGLPLKICSTEFEEYAYCLMEEHSLQQPRNVLDAMEHLSLLLVDMEDY